MDPYTKGKLRLGGRSATAGRGACGTKCSAGRGDCGTMRIAVTRRRACGTKCVDIDWVDAAGVHSNQTGWSRWRPISIKPLFKMFFRQPL